MAKTLWNTYDINERNIFGTGGIFDHNQPEDLPLNNLLLESGFRVRAENGDFIALEN